MSVFARILAAAALAACCAAGACRSAAPRGDSAVANEGVPMGGIGLETSRWYLESDPSVRARGIEQALASGLAARVECDFARNGFTVLSVPATRLGELLAVLGGSPTERRTTLGQVTAWADLATARIERERVMVVGGRIGPIAPRDDDRAGGPDLEALVRLSLRGWCFPTVEGAVARLELRATEEPARAGKLSLDPSRGRDRARLLRFGKAALECPAGQAVVILETPVVPADPSEDDGPPAATPPTVAALLMDGAPFPDRALAVAVIPSFADILPAAAPLRVSTEADAAAPSAPTGPEP
ncbi:MAG: hypothetical protein ACKOYN_13195 [Planctomycetota bacterium]